MVDQLISFETAKLAKEKGFISKSPYYQIDDADEIDLVDMKGFPLHSNDQEGDYYEAPTQSLLQKWLREKHNMSIEIGCTISKFWIWHIYEISSGELLLGFTKHSESYEEALEAGLYQGLLLIK